MVVVSAHAVRGRRGYGTGRIGMAEATALMIATMAMVVFIVKVDVGCLVVGGGRLEVGIG